MLPDRLKRAQAIEVGDTTDNRLALSSSLLDPTVDVLRMLTCVKVVQYHDDHSETMQSLVIRSDLERSLQE